MFYIIYNTVKHLPMHNTSTSQPTTASSHEATIKGPSAKTLAFLRQFARAYTYIPSSKPQLASFIAN